MSVALVTGSSGLVGSQCVKFFHELGYTVIGIDNNMRKLFFGSDGNTDKTKIALENQYSRFKCFETDIRDRLRIEKIFNTYGSEIDIIVHAAAQPSHDWAAKDPHLDFGVNAVGTLVMLEAARNFSPDATFIFTSTNKVYGDRPNTYFNLVEQATRYECLDSTGTLASVNESMPIDYTLHSIFGASKASADLMCQEYGRYFGMKTGVFRGGCLTGPLHAGVELHGFLSYLTKCIATGKKYTVFGFKGKQVRDNIHSSDLVSMFWEFHKRPMPGAVFNVGGGRENSISMLEAIEKISYYCQTESFFYNISDESRVGDHIWYITDLTKFKTAYPNWKIKVPLDTLIQEMVSVYVDP